MLGCLENIDEEEHSHPHENSDAHTTSSVTTTKMMSEHVEPDAFETPCSNQTLRPNLKHY